MRRDNAKPPELRPAPPTRHADLGCCPWALSWSFCLSTSVTSRHIPWGQRAGSLFPDLPPAPASVSFPVSGASCLPPREHMGRQLQYSARRQHPPVVLLSGPCRVHPAPVPLRQRHTQTGRDPSLRVSHPLGFFGLGLEHGAAQLKPVALTRDSPSGCPIPLCLPSSRRSTPTPSRCFPTQWILVLCVAEATLTWSSPVHSWTLESVGASVPQVSVVSHMATSHILDTMLLLMWPRRHSFLASRITLLFQ